MADKMVFEIGDRIELSHIRSAMGRVLSTNKYGSQLLDYNATGTVTISMPIFENKVIPLEVDDEYQLCFFTNAGMYQCNAKVIKRYAIKNKMYVVDMFIYTPLKKFQRRKFYRLECMFPIKYRILSEVERILIERLMENKFRSEEDKKACEETLEQMPKVWNEATVSDLSGGGIRFHSKTEVVPDTMIEVMLPLSLESGIMPAKFVMKVISCIHSAGSRIAYEIRGEFENVKDSDRDIVIKYVFQEQRRRMRKE